jgi:quercetin dioxygenase-like cupin family protein
MKRHLAILALACVVTAHSARAADSPAVAPLLTKPLGIEGKEGLMLTVEYAPGGSSVAHRHNANVFVYVLEGAVVMQVAGGKEQTLTAGQTFYESPDDVHTVSRNASQTQKAKILVFMVKQKDAPATAPVK